MKCKALELLIAEHKVILRSVDVLSAIAKQAEENQQLNKEDVREILEIFHTFADELHQGKEESALFPAFTAACNRADIDPVRHMVFEHEQDRSLIEGMENALLRSSPADFAKLAGRMANILRTHIYKEDHILFEIVDRALTPEDDRSVVSQFEQFDRDFKLRGNDRLLQTLRKLEWKYLHKAA
jgi:hemerythrin-like domain-containing protein